MIMNRNGKEETVDSLIGTREKLFDLLSEDPQINRIEYPPSENVNGGRQRDERPSRLATPKMKMWDMSEVAFFQLLARLNPDPALAGEEYEKLRARLIFFFQRKGSRIAAELADETINRIARKIEEGYEIKDLFKFSHGVARFVLMEHWDDPKREWEQLDEQLSSSECDRDVDDHRLVCMKKCLQSLLPEERDLILKNCTLNKNGKAELARSLSLTINALRRRVYRNREKLHECCENCVRNS
jgi:DNA-directed RNA polymerase specialized sigma24 family protein